MAGCGEFLQWMEGEIPDRALKPSTRDFWSGYACGSLADRQKKPDSEVGFWAIGSPG